MTTQTQQYPVGSVVSFFTMGPTDNEPLHLTGVVDGAAGIWRRVVVEGQPKPFVKVAGELRAAVVASV